MDPLSRRSFIGTTIGSAVALGLGKDVLARDPGGTPPPQGAASRTRSLRVAHLTDIHVQPERGAGEGLARCLEHVRSLKDAPDLIVTGGDLVMDSFGADDARTKLQWELFTKTWRDHCPLRVEHTLGNHDIWGWHKKHSKTTGSEPSWGKRRALDVLGMGERYHSYDVRGWHVVHLDSTHPDPNNPDGYIGKLDEAQLDWFARDLAAVPKGTHTLVVSHIPILSATVILGKPEKDNTYKVSGGEMHTDSEALRKIMEERGSVRACLSGHIHRLDRVDFRGISYYCNGAVSGSWWKGPQAEAFEGYAVMDLFSDGTVERQYVGYGWQARK